MNERAYYGHESQLFGVEEYRLTGGKGDGMRLLQVRRAGLHRLRRPLCRYFPPAFPRRKLRILLSKRLRRARLL